MMRCDPKPIANCKWQIANGKLIRHLPLAASGACQLAKFAICNLQFAICNLLTITALFWNTGQTFAQPTYKLGVGAHLNPSATLKLEGTAITRSAVRDDPGFRLQYHFLKDGKTLTTAEARAQ